MVCDIGTDGYSVADGLFCLCGDVVCVGLFCVGAANSWALFVTMDMEAYFVTISLLSCKY